MASIKFGKHDSVPISSEEGAILDEYFRVIKSANVQKRKLNWFCISLFGSRGVGKEAVLKKGVHGVIPLAEQPYDPTESDPYRRQTTINNWPWMIYWKNTSNCGCELENWELKLICQNIRDSNACVLVYDVSNVSSFEALPALYESILPQLTTTPFRSDVPCDKKPVLVVASKIDLPAADWAIPKNQGEEFAASIGGTFFETSAKEDIGIKEMILAGIRTALIHFAGEGLKARSTVAAGPDYVCLSPKNTEQSRAKPGGFGKPKSIMERIRWYKGCIIA